MSRAVIDQPGSRVLMIGLALSFFLGLAIRSQISHEKVEKTLQTSVDRLEKDFIVDFESAEVSLSKWGLPLPHLVVNKIRLSPKKAFCQNSQIYVDQIEVPLSLSAIVLSKSIVDTLRANEVQIRIADLENCASLEKKENGKKTDKSFENVDAKTKSTPIQQDIERLFKRQTQAQLKDIYIEQLKIITTKQPEQPVLLRHFHVALDYDQNNLSKIELKSGVHALKDAKTEIYFLVGELNALIKTDDKKEIEGSVKIKGRMLDGDIQLFAHANSSTQKLIYDLSIKKVSIKAFTSLFDFEKIEPFLESWPVNISFKIYGEEDFKKGSAHTAKLTDFAIQGESTSISTSTEVEIKNKNSQVHLSPFKLQIQKMPLNAFKSISLFKAEMQSFENLGDITGYLDFSDFNRWAFVGEVKNTELIFSNKGEREIEKIDSFNVQLEQKNKDYEAQLNQFVINNEKILGEVDASYVSENQGLLAKMNLEGRLFTEKIWQHFTDVKQKPILKLNWSFKKTNDVRHQLKLSLPELLFNGITFNDMQVDFLQASEEQTKSLVLSMKSHKVSIDVAELKDSITKSLFSDETGLKASRYTSNKILLSMQGTDWKNMSFDFDSTLQDESNLSLLEHLKAKGQWTDDNHLSAYATLQNTNRQLRYNIIKNKKDEINMVLDK